MSRPLILVVEDEAFLRISATVILEDAGFDTLDAASADEAIVHLETNRLVVIIFTDIDMPGSMDGLRLAVVIRNRWPPIDLVFDFGTCSCRRAGHTGARSLPAEALRRGAAGPHHALLRPLGTFQRQSMHIAGRAIANWPLRTSALHTASSGGVLTLVVIGASPHVSTSTLGGANDRDPERRRLRRCLVCS